jgi:hypothetical protein
MAQDHYSELIGKKFVGLSVVLALVFWACFTRMILPFVPAETHSMQYLFGGITAACLTGVFFVASHMFRLVYVENKKAKAERNS